MECDSSTRSPRRRLTASSTLNDAVAVGILAVSHCQLMIFATAKLADCDRSGGGGRPGRGGDSRPYRCRRPRRRGGPRVGVGTCRRRARRPGGGGADGRAAGVHPTDRNRPWRRGGGGAAERG